MSAALTCKASARVGYLMAGLDHFDSINDAHIRFTARATVSSRA